MAYDTTLEIRIDEVISSWDIPALKKKMFGGLAYMVQGNMAFGVHGDELIVRAQPEKTAFYMKQPEAHEFTMGRGHMNNIFMAGGDMLEEPMLSELLQTGRDYALSLPPK
ncbi:MAG TPA: TfoX/Sxy family protein [Candidatus Saccharimonadales bacterium]|nr:TfoX/Sxy family protein [Candidatus Saccharimonadales bacterium]